MALMTMLMIAASPLEISLTAEGRVRTAAWIIFLSDAVRVAGSVVPLFLGLGLQGFFWSYVIHGALRFALQCFFFFRRGRPQLDWRLLREQLAYALPFGAAVLLDIPQRTFHQWAVGWSVDAAAFAIYAQGCFQVPIINLLYAPISDILQVPPRGARRSRAPGPPLPRRESAARGGVLPADGGTGGGGIAVRARRCSPTSTTRASPSSGWRSS